MNITTPIPLVVFDTNICLDFFVFHDTTSYPLLQAVKSQKFQAITRQDCREEFLRVLDYPKFNLTHIDKTKATTDFDQLIQVIQCPPKNHHFLPICTDHDDQKFMEIAFDANAQFLFSKDKALLKLAKRNKKYGLFRIMSPTTWISESKQYHFN